MHNSELQRQPFKTLRIHNRASLWHVVGEHECHCVSLATRLNLRVKKLWSSLLKHGIIITQASTDDSAPLRSKKIDFVVEIIASDLSRLRRCLWYFAIKSKNNSMFPMSSTLFSNCWGLTWALLKMHWCSAAPSRKSNCCWCRCNGQDYEEKENHPSIHFL